MFSDKRKFVRKLNWIRKKVDLFIMGELSC